MGSVVKFLGTMLRFAVQLDLFRVPDSGLGPGISTFGRSLVWFRTISLSAVVNLHGVVQDNLVVGGG